MGIKEVFYGCGNDRFGGCGGVVGVDRRVPSFWRVGRIYALSSIEHPSHPPYNAIGGHSREEAILILRRFYVTENSNGTVIYGGLMQSASF